MENFSESNYLYNVKAGVKLTPNHDSTYVDLVLQPKGSGSIFAQQADGTVSRGNNRGVFAVDFQTERLTADKVASGQNSFIGGGNNNAVSVSYATVYRW